jgi:cellulose synthase/poly-beta-1,6-N-acetylglucosamine synthase-like glycosyltransferase
MDAPFWPAVIATLAALLALLAALPYALLMGRFAAGVRRLLERPLPEPDPDALPRVSVVVAARNEEAALGFLLTELVEQDYPGDRLEVVVADDRSSDGTAALVEEFARRHPHRVRLVRIEATPEGWTGKKWALEQAVRSARGEVVLMTDADCLPGRRWVVRMAAPFTADPELGLVAGAVDYRDAQGWRWPRRLLRTEFVTLSLVGGGSLSTGFPLVVSGQNLAFRKSLFETVGGYREHAAIPSGDDVFLLFAAARAGTTCRYVLAPEAVVTTTPPAGWVSFWNQRVRWASKGVRYPRGPFLFSLLVWLLHALLLAAGLGLLLDPKPATAALLLAALVIKGAGDLALLRPGRRLGLKGVEIDYLSALPLHIPYITLFGLAGALGLFRWK